MVNKTLIFLMMGIFIFSLASVTAYKINEDVPIRITGVVNGSISSISANLTVYDPEKEVLVSFAEMTKNADTNDFNYTVTGSSIDSVGEYTGTVCFYSTLVDIEDECVGISFEVTTIGQDVSISQSILYFILIIVLCGFFVFSFYASVKIPWSNERNNDNEIMNINYKKYLKLFFIVISYLLFLWIVYSGWNLSFAFTNFGFLSNFFQAMFYFMMALTFPIIVSILLLGFIAFIKDMKVKDYLDLGVNVDI